MSGKHITVPESVYKKGCVTTVEEAIKSAAQIGYPVMIKASEGGGGKGIRKVESPEEFHAVFRQVCSYRNPNMFKGTLVIPLITELKSSVCRCTA